jgi:hypothetical protein
MRAIATAERSSGSRSKASSSSMSTRAFMRESLALKRCRVAKRSAPTPNPSLKRSDNGRPPAPGRWYAVHFHRPGAGGLPLSPA